MSAMERIRSRKRKASKISSFNERRNPVWRPPAAAMLLLLSILAQSSLISAFRTTLLSSKRSLRRISPLHVSMAEPTPLSPPRASTAKPPYEPQPKQSSTRLLGNIINGRNGKEEAPRNVTLGAPHRKEALLHSKRSIWRRRHARSADEGIRRESSSAELSQLLRKANVNSKRYAARTLAGLLHALAEEVSDLQVQVDAREDTPLWNKHVDSLKVSFSRLGFKPLKLGGLDYPDEKMPEDRAVVEDTLLLLRNPDEAFSRMDADNSGALDREELAQALVAATTADTSAMNDLATDLLELYDTNGDGVVDRDEYQSMVEDMATLRSQTQVDSVEGAESGGNIFSRSWNTVISLFSRKSESVEKAVVEGVQQVMADVSGELLAAEQNDELSSRPAIGQNNTNEIVLVPGGDKFTDEVSKTIGSITFENLKLDLRRLVFGGVPLLKRVTPGGPLILEPFTTTIEGSFNKDDIMESFLLDAGLRRLVARALRRRVRSFRDFIDGALFHGRSWTMASAAAPLVEVPRLTKVEFDKKDRLIITGRAKIRPRSDAPQFEQAFKVRTKIGTRKDGRTIRLVEPELAFVLECPSAWEANIFETYKLFGLKKPKRPEPIYSFFPIYSPFKVDDNDGFYLGEDNTIKSIFIKDGALRFELSAVLRPGRFLGNHYIAFSIPNRTFIVTLDRIKQGMRAARMEKRANDARKRMLAKRKIEPKDAEIIEEVVRKKQEHNRVEASPPRSFFSRFVDGYLQAEQDEESERVLDAIRDFFGKQHTHNK